MDHPAAQDLLIRHDEAGVAVLTLNAPARINALSDAMLEALGAALDDIAEDPAVRAVILRSAGAQFCAGHDLREMTARRDEPDGGRASFEALFARCSAVMLRIRRLPQPVIAEVKGIATAAGCQLVAAADLALASEEARFATSGVTIGLFCATPMVALSRAVAPKHALEMLFLGDFVSAARAAEIGLVNRVVAREDLEASAMAMARRIAEHSPAAIRAGKRAFREQSGLAPEAAYDLAGRVMAENMMARDAEGGIAAFLAKAPMPEWTGE